MVVAEIATGYGALKTAYEIAKGLKNIDDRVKLNDAVIELQEKILSAQEDAADAKEKLRELQMLVETLENWERIVSRYKLIDYGASTFAYQLRPEWEAEEPAHRVCATCFQKKARAILQFSYRDVANRDHFKCFSCGNEFEFGFPQPVRQDQSANDWSPYG